MRAFRVRDIKSALRLIARVLFMAQKGEIQNADAKLILYGCQVYATTVKDSLLELRVAALEDNIKSKKGNEKWKT